MKVGDLIRLKRAEKKDTENKQKNTIYCIERLIAILSMNGLAT
jgi:hypothetical protein